MSNSVQIVLIICATLICLGIIGTINDNRK